MFLGFTSLISYTPTRWCQVAASFVSVGNQIQRTRTNQDGWPGYPMAALIQFKCLMRQSLGAAVWYVGRTPWFGIHRPFPPKRNTVATRSSMSRKTKTSDQLPHNTNNMFNYSNSTRKSYQRSSLTAMDKKTTKKITKNCCCVVTISSMSLHKQSYHGAIFGNNVFNLYFAFFFTGK